MKVSRVIYASYCINSNFLIIDCDDYFLDLTGYTREDIKEQKVSQNDLIFEEDSELYKSMALRCIGKSGEAFLEHRIKRKDGKELYVFCIGNLEKISDSSHCFKIKMVDVTNMMTIKAQENKLRTEQKQQVQRLQTVASIDELTGTLRRGAFINKINSLSFVQPSTLLMIDVDDFKSINDNCGHKIGDDVLKMIGQILNESVRSNDYVCRIGGDEFAVLLNGVNDKKIISEIVERIRDRVRSIETVLHCSVPTHVTVGVKINNDKNCKFDDIYSAADAALYKAKGRGKDQFLIWPE